MTPIVDSHAYCFSAPDTLAGHPTVAEHMALWQWGYARHHQPAFRVRDRAPGDSTPPPRDGAGRDGRRCADRDFRVDHERERLVWTVDGEDYTKVFLPPNTLEYSAGNLIADMDYAGVDWALLHVDAALSKDVEYLAACVRAYPDRLRSMAPVDEWRIESEPGRGHRRGDATPSRSTASTRSRSSPSTPTCCRARQGFDGPAWRPFWDAVTQPRRADLLHARRAARLDRPASGLPRRALDRWLAGRTAIPTPGRASPTASTGGIPWSATGSSCRTRCGSRSATVPTCRIEVSFAVRIGDLFDYPWTVTQPVLEAMVEHIGADRLLWGTDMPFQNRFCTYRQSRDAIERYSPFLDPDQMAALMGGTAARILRIPDA